MLLDSSRHFFSFIHEILVSSQIYIPLKTDFLRIKKITLYPCCTKSYNEVVQYKQRLYLYSIILKRDSSVYPFISCTRNVCIYIRHLLSSSTVCNLTILVHYTDCFNRNMHFYHIIIQFINIYIVICKLYTSIVYEYKSESFLMKQLYLWKIKNHFEFPHLSQT